MNQEPMKSSVSEAHGDACGSLSGTTGGTMVCAHCGTPLVRAVESEICAVCADAELRRVIHRAQAAERFDKLSANKFGTFRDRNGILHACRYVGPVPPEDFNNEIVVDGLIYVDYCLDDGTPIKNAIIHQTDFKT